jgi:hypothetical protein
VAVTTIERFKLDHILASIPADAPERCLYVDHAWSAWGPFISEAMPLPPISHIPLALDPTPEKLKANRQRGCVRCGTVENEQYADGSRRIVEDPLGIDARIRREP